MGRWRTICWPYVAYRHTQFTPLKYCCIITLKVCLQNLSSMQWCVPWMNLCYAKRCHCSGWWSLHYWNGDKNRTRRAEGKTEPETEAHRHTRGDYLCLVTRRIGLKMSFSSGTNVSMLSGVPRRLPTMLCCSVAAPPVGVKFYRKKRQPIIHSIVLVSLSRSLMENTSSSIDSWLAALIIP